MTEENCSKRLTRSALHANDAATSSTDNAIDENGTAQSGTSTKRKREQSPRRNAKSLRPDVSGLHVHDHDLELDTFEFETNEFPSYCLKRDGHDKFVPVEDFDLSHLPEKYRDELFVELVRAVAQVVVRMTVKYTTIMRPDGYALFKQRGCPRGSCGSGWMQNVGRKVEQAKKKNEMCPCVECLDSPSPQRTWGEVKVRTAKHVIFNTEEARKTVYELFFSDENSSVVPETLTGSRVLNSDIDKDKCEVSLITHDLKLWNKLERSVQWCDELHERLKEKYWLSSQEQEHKLVIIVSHPHGMKKHVSVGEVIEKNFMKDGDVKFAYNTPTCAGCSGAPVYTLARDWFLVFCDHPHSGATPDGLNRSAYGAS